jgi:hypothetical protein
MNEEEAELRLNEAIKILSEHFDHVQILVSWNEEAETRDLAMGSGNWYARLALCRELILRHDCQELVQQQYERYKLYEEKKNEDEEDDIS